MDTCEGPSDGARPNGSWLYLGGGPAIQTRTSWNAEQTQGILLKYV